MILLKSETISLISICFPFQTKKFFPKQSSDLMFDFVLNKVIYENFLLNIEDNKSNFLLMMKALACNIFVVISMKLEEF